MADQAFPANPHGWLDVLQNARVITRGVADQACNVSMRALPWWGAPSPGAMSGTGGMGGQHRPALYRNTTMPCVHADRAEW